MNQRTSTPSSRLLKLANNLAAYGHPLSVDARRIAQQLPDITSADGPVPEGLKQALTEGVKDDKPGFDPSHEPPQIESFVRPRQQSVIKVHTATVSFEAPPKISEEQIMEYVLAIDKHLQVMVKSFNWSVKDSAPMGGGSKSAGFNFSRYAQQAVDLGSYGKPDDDGGIDPSHEGGSPIESLQAGLYQIHTATVGFEAAESLDKTEIISYVNGIRDALGVKVKSFSWKVSDKQRQG